MSELKIMTLNVKNASITSSFAKRAISIQELVRWHDPDIIGTQELIDPMIDYLPELTETYTFYGKARGSAGNTNERTCLLFKKDRFELLRGDTFWLSSTPDVRGSRFLESLFPRISTFALLKDKLTEQTFTFANTHLDHLLPATRAKRLTSSGSPAAAMPMPTAAEVPPVKRPVATGPAEGSMTSFSQAAGARAPAAAVP